MSEGFLWINKNGKSASLSSSSNTETKDIFQFVQYKRKGHQRATKPRLPARKGLSGRGRGNRIWLAPSPASRHTDVGNGLDNSTASDRRRDGGPHTPSPELDAQQLSITPLNLRAGACVDPFDSTVTPITKPMEAMFKYFWKMVTAGGPNMKEEALPLHVRMTQSYGALSDQVMREALSDRLALTGLLATMSARMICISKMALPGNTRPEHYIEAMIQILRDRLIDSQARGERPTPSIYYGIWRLAHAECILGDFDAVRVHLQACKELLQYLEEDSPLERYVRVGVCTVDMFRAIETDSRDMVLAQHHEEIGEFENLTSVKEQVQIAAQSRSSTIASKRDQPDPVTSMTPFDDILNDAHQAMDFTLGEGLANAQTAGVFDRPLDAIIRDILDCLTMAKYVWRTPLATKEDAQWMCNMAKSCLRRLCTLPTGQHTMRGKKTEALRLALIIMLSRAVTRYAHRSSIPNMRRLRRALRGVDVNWATNTDNDELLLHAELSAYDENHLLLWTLMTGHHTAYGLEEEEMWFRERAAFVAHRLGITDYAGLHRHMRRFLYSRTKQRASLETVALHLS